VLAAFRACSARSTSLGERASEPALRQQQRCQLLQQRAAGNAVSAASDGSISAFASLNFDTNAKHIRTNHGAMLRMMNCSVKPFDCQTTYCTHYYHNHPPPHNAIIIIIIFIITITSDTVRTP